MAPSTNHARDVAIVRRRLLQRRDELLRRHRDMLTEERELLEADETDLPDVAANRTRAALLERLDDADLVQLKRIGDAIARLDAGCYGICVVCGRRIARARLEIMPETDRCEHCHNSH